MELPIDHFRLLGVGPATDAQNVLRTLQRRIDRPPEQGFTADTLLARAELLRASADLLSDSARRAAYEADLTALSAAAEPVMPALDVPSSREVAGLLLLLEANQPQECFELACRALQPPQAPALGSSRETDLTLIAGQACLDAATELEEQRHYEAAARTLQQGLQLLQRMGQAPLLRERMSEALDRLTPYRVLDLLCRDLSAVDERREGLALLEQLVQRRGGLEGHADMSFGSAEFQAFFKQIRDYLTVQEQVDLFHRWAEGGSAAASFLASIAQTASGFAQRKPERIAAARDRLLASGREGLEPLLANLHLLLGEVDQALALFDRGASKDLRAWAARQGGEDALAKLCAYCRDWLSRDVLSGYRDLDLEADLEAYFSDRDVIAWVEREDRKAGRHYRAVPPAAETSPSDWSAAAGAGAAAESAFAGFDLAGFPSAGQASLSGGQPGELPHPDEDEEDDWLPQFSLPALGRPLWIGAAVVVALLLGGTWWWRSQLGEPGRSGRVQPLPVRPVPPVVARAPAATPTATPPAAAPAKAPSAPRPSVAVAAAAVPLTAAEPDEAALRTLLQTWLDAKVAVMAGRSAPANLDQIARAEPIERLEGERRDDKVQGLRQTISARITGLRISESDPRRIAVTAELAYSDERRDGSGTVLDRTAPTTLRNVYVFARDPQGWRLAASSPAD